MSKSAIPRHHLRNQPEVIATEQLGDLVSLPPEHLPLVTKPADYIDPPDITAAHPYTERQILEDLQPLSNPALHQYMQWATQSMATIVNTANLEPAQLAIMRSTMQELLKKANDLEPTDASGVKQLRTDLTNFLAKTFLPNMRTAGQDIDDLPDNLIETIGPVITSHRFNALAAATQTWTEEPKTSTAMQSKAVRDMEDSSVLDFNTILRRYEFQMANDSNASAFAQLPSVTVVQIYWSGGGEE